MIHFFRICLWQLCQRFDIYKPPGHCLRVWSWSLALVIRPVLCGPKGPCFKPAAFMFLLNFGWGIIWKLWSYMDLWRLKNLSNHDLWPQIGWWWSVFVCFYPLREMNTIIWRFALKLAREQRTEIIPKLYVGMLSFCWCGSSWSPIRVRSNWPSEQNSLCEDKNRLSWLCYCCFICHS